MAHTAPTARSFTVFGAIERLGEEDTDTVALLHQIAKAIGVLERLVPQAVAALDPLRPCIVLDVAASHQPGAMALVGTLGLFPTSVDEGGAAMLRAAVARATPAQRADLIRLMVGIARIH
jgi:hypothetical protein